MAHDYFGVQRVPNLACGSPSIWPLCPGTPGVSGYTLYFLLLSSLLEALCLLLYSGNLEPCNVSPGRTVEIILIPPFGFTVEKTEALGGEVACEGPAVSW